MELRLEVSIIVRGKRATWVVLIGSESVHYKISGAISFLSLSPNCDPALCDFLRGNQLWSLASMRDLLLLLHP